MPDALDNKVNDQINLQGGPTVLLMECTDYIFRFNQNPYTHNYVPILLDSGQSYSISANTFANSISQAQKYIMHAFYSNSFDTPEFRQRISLSRPTLQRQTFVNIAFAAGRISTQDVTVPTDRGNVVALQLFAEGTTALNNNYFSNRVSVSVNGIQVIRDACCLYFVPDCTRRGLIFPIEILPSSTITISFDDSLISGSGRNLRLVLYFDDDLQ
jgi:hypothetical protein